MSSCVELLRGAFAESSEALGRVLADIGDEEFFREPVAYCWTVHPRSEVRAASADGCGAWVIDYEVPDPDPAPVTTIAWRTVHIAHQVRKVCPTLRATDRPNDSRSNSNRQFAEFYAAARDDCPRIVLISMGAWQLAEDLAPMPSPRRGWPGGR